MSGGRDHVQTIRGKGREMRSWPLFALLLLVVLVGIACVLWFMREAAQNERLAVRQRMAEAYRAHLTLAQARLAEQWTVRLAALDGGTPGPVWFARCARESLAGSVVCLGEDGRAIYPQAAAPNLDAADTGEGASADDRAAQAIGTEARASVARGDAEAAIRLIATQFAGDRLAHARDAQGRLAGANAELFALELMRSPDHPLFAEIAGRLAHRIEDYATTALPSAQRRFLMRELAHRQPGKSFPTRAAEDLAARYLEATLPPPLTGGCAPSGLPDVWHAASPARRVIALWTTASVREELRAFLGSEPLPPGITLAPLAPGEEPPTDGTGAVLLTAQAGAPWPGWRLALSLDDRAIFQTAADRKVAAYRWTAAFVVALMTLLAALVARAFRRQVRLSRLKNDLVATVSHELKTPLTAMRALVDTLLEADHIEEQTAREYLELIAGENARLSRVIDHFLTFSRLERDRFSFRSEHVRPESIVQAAVAAMGERCRKPDCLLEVQIASPLPAVAGDADALVTALLNLLDNAWKYTGDCKRITVRADAAGSVVRFSVEDNGSGLSPGESRRIFREFYQADRQLTREAGGCGLGLSIVRRIVAAHGGEVRVASEQGRGSTFTLEIPAAPQAGVVS